MSAARVVGLAELPSTTTARELVGADHGGAGVCLIFVDAPPGHGPSLHRHPYEEVFLILEGEATFTLGDETRTARAGDFLIAPPGVPHAFKNTGSGPLRSVDVHASPTFDTEYL